MVVEKDNAGAIGCRRAGYYKNQVVVAPKSHRTLGIPAYPRLILGLSQAYPRLILGLSRGTPQIPTVHSGSPLILGLSSAYPRLILGLSSAYPGEPPKSHRTLGIPAYPRLILGLSQAYPRLILGLSGTLDPAYPRLTVLDKP